MWDIDQQRYSNGIRICVVAYALILGCATVLYWLIGRSLAFAGTTGIGPLDWQIKRCIELAIGMVPVIMIGYGGYRRWSFGRIGTLTCLLMIFWAWWLYIFAYA